MSTPSKRRCPAHTVLALGLLAAATAQAAALSYADVGTGLFGSMSWVTRDYHFYSVTEYDNGGPIPFHSGRSYAWHNSYADAAMSGQAESSLFDGTLHVSAFAAAWGPNAAPHTSAYRAGAGTAMWDRITVGADEGTHLIPLSLRVDGWVNDFANAQVRYYVGPSDPFTQFATQPFQGWKYLNGNPSSTGRRDWDTVFELGSIEIDSAYDGWPLNVFFEMSVSAYSGRGRGGIGDFSHTARFGWDLPAGVTVQSASGQFMRATTQAVPEPPTAALALLALALLPALRHWPRASTGCRTAHRAS